jgi:CSLREA domain-containing protein
MQHRRVITYLFSLLVFAACTDQEAPTSPDAAPEPGSPAFSHTAGHKVVNSRADPGDGTCNATECTLREAINAPGSTEISFAPGLTGPITLAAPAAGGGTLAIDKRLSITGPSQQISIWRRSTAPEFGILQIGSSGTATLTNLIIRGGKALTIADLGGILNRGTLRLINCVVAGNSATFGGGIDNEGTLTLTHSRVAHNSGFDGGGIINNGTLRLTNSTVSGNSAVFGGGINNDRGTLTLTNSRIAGNTAFSGGGIEGLRGTLTNTTVAANSADRQGGGISMGGEATLRNSTVTGNTAGFAGGGISNAETLTLTNSTVSGNSAEVGGGVANFGSGATLTLRNSTVARNSATQHGGGISNTGGSELALRNSLLALNAGPLGPDVLNNSGATVTARFSLLGIGNGSGITNGVNGNQVGSQAAPLDPKLGPLAFNGGPTRTRALQPGSPAIDAASTPDCPTTDQRGVLRPQGAACDIGSYERK